MYFKMAFNNVKKSFKDYTIYFLTLTFAVSIFYSFNSINSQTLMANINSVQKQYIRLLNVMIGMLSTGISVILGCLIIYATNFLIKKRKKEFGIYMTLGMSKKSMSFILFFETLFIGLISLCAGLALGLIFAQVLSVFTAKLFDVEMTKYAFSISFQAIFKTIIYFGIIYIVVMLFNTIVISKYKLIDLIYGSRKNEKIKVKNSYLSSAVTILSIIILGIAYREISICELEFTSIHFKLAIVCGIIGTFMFFYGISSLTLNMLSRKSRIYLNELNVFTIKQISSRFNTNFISISVICLMLLITIGSLSCGFAVKTSMESALNKCTPVDATVFTLDTEMADTTLNLVSEAQKQYNLNLDDFNYATLKNYTIDYNVKDVLYDYADREDRKKVLDYPMMNEADLVKISDYNNFMKLNGREIVKLKEDEVLLCSNYSMLKETMANYIKSEKTISLRGKNYNIKNNKIIEDSFYNMPMLQNVFLLIVPDNCVKENDKYGEVLNLKLKNYDKDKIKALDQKFMSMQNELLFSDNNNKDYKTFGFTKKMCYDSNRGVSAMVLFITVYIGIVFLIASAAVLALQQLSECNDSLERYKVLNKIGADMKMIKRSIFNQILTFFLLPLSLAVVHSYVGVKVVNSYIMALGESNNIYPMIITIIIMVIVYGGYFYATYISYKNIIENEL